MKKITFLIVLVFFLSNVWILPHYGINWDEPIHFFRGNAILHYFLTGNKDYSDLLQFKKYYQRDDTIFFDPLDKKKSQVIARSTYQDNQANFKFFLVDYGHPPLSDIFASFFNYVFFQRLRIINDSDSYHIYSVFLAAVLLGFVFLWTARKYNIFTGFVTLFSLALYPLFLGESHYNIKDIPEMVFYALTIISFSEAIIRKKNFLFVLSAIFCGFALGTKFNIVFVLFILLPWTFLYLLRSKEVIRKYVKIVPSIVAYPIIAVSIFYVSWPFLWQSPINNFLHVLNYYEGIGINQNFDSRFITYFGFNTYALKWIIFSTPLVILFFSFFGLLYFFINGRKEKEYTSLLIILWLFIPIARVTAPYAGIYGGVRHIMEFIPALAILSGIGAQYFTKILYGYVGKHNISLLSLHILVALFFLPLAIKLISIHPNEGVYFNPIIGGLKGAKERNIPEWGQNLGNVNKQGIMWINRHAEKNASLATNFGLGSSIETLFLRNDLKFSNVFRSVLEKKGEYIIGLTHQSGFEDTYFFKYLDIFLNPVYTVDVDGVSILKIWKNDSAHTKEQYRNMIEFVQPNTILGDSSIIVDMGEIVLLAKLHIWFSTERCERDTEGLVDISSDDIRWYTRDGNLRAQSLLPETTYKEDNSFVYYFAADRLRYVRINFESKDSCFKNIKKVSTYGFH